MGALIRKDTRYISRCIQLNGDVLKYLSTANTARDMNAIREAVGDKKMTYLGFSYGTFLGATLQSLFPGKTRAVVLDGALDADQYITTRWAASTSRPRASSARSCASSSPARRTRPRARWARVTRRARSTI